MSVEEPDALEQSQELYGSVMESVMETTEPPQVNEEDPYSYNPFDFTQLPQTEGEVKTAIEDLTQKFRTGGLTRRNLLNRSLKECPEKWKALRRPASMHTSQLSLAAMLTCVTQVDRDQFQEYVDGNVNIPLYIMEKYMLPSLRIRGFMHDKTIEALPGEADTLMAYLFFSQGSVMPRFRTEHDLEVLRNTVFSAETFISEQMEADKEVSEGLSSHLKATIRRLKKETTLPDYDHLSNMNQDQLDDVKQA